MFGAALRHQIRSYTKVRHLGEGAFASVDECVLRGQHVAVKRLKPELFANEVDLKSFVAEGVTIAKLSHPCALRRTRTGCVSTTICGCVVQSGLRSPVHRIAACERGRALHG